MNIFFEGNLQGMGIYDDFYKKFDFFKVFFCNLKARDEYFNFLKIFSLVKLFMRQKYYSNKF